MVPFRYGDLYHSTWTDVALGVCYTGVFIPLCPAAVATDFPDSRGLQVAPDGGGGQRGEGGRLDLKLFAQQMHRFTASLKVRRGSDTLCENGKCQLLHFKERAGAPLPDHHSGLKVLE